MDITFAIFILNKYINNLFLKYFQTLKKLYRYLLKTKLIFKYIGISEIYIILKILSDGNIYLNIYNNLDWDKNKNNYYSITDYFFKIVGGVIS